MKFLNTTVTNKTNSFFACKIFSNAFVSVKIFWMFILALWLMMDENAIDVDGDSLEVLLKNFNIGQKVLHWHWHISDIISPISPLIMSSCLSRIFSFVLPWKFTIFTLWLTLRPFSEIPLSWSLRLIRFSVSYSKVSFEFLFFVSN